MGRDGTRHGFAGRPQASPLRPSESVLAKEKGSFSGGKAAPMAVGLVEVLIGALAGFFYVLTGYHVLLIFSGLRLTRKGRKPFDKGSLRNPVDLPTVSLIIPAKDEEVVIEGAIRAADRLEYPKDLIEIIVVEDDF